MGSVHSWNQEIPRQGSWGLYVSPVADSTKQQLKLDHDAVLVRWVKPESTSAQTGVEVGDVLTQINDFPVRTPQDIYFSGFLNSLRDGDAIAYHVIRDGKSKTFKGKVIPKPRETNKYGDIVYNKVRFKDGYLRTILTVPHKVQGKKAPVVYLIPGYNCASYDNMVPFHPYQKIIDSLTALGYAVFRCEKSGMGDSYNTPNCFDIDFHTEQAGFEAGYEHLLTYDDIDTSQIYIFGHSLGGINAPILAEKYNPKGVIVYGTTHLPWMEYLTDMLRFQNTLLGIPPVQVEKDAMVYQRLLYDHYVNKLSPEELIEKDTAYLSLLQRDFQYIGGDMIFQRHYTFMQQLNDLNLTESWSNVKSHVLSIYGEADFEALNPDAHKAIVNIVNYYHPGKGTFYLLPETNHSFIKVGSMEDGVEARKNGQLRQLMQTSFNYKIIEEIDDWIQSLEE